MLKSQSLLSNHFIVTIKKKVSCLLTNTYFIASVLVSLQYFISLNVNLSMYV